MLFEDDPQFWFETLRAMGHGAYGMAEPGEVLAVARQIPSGDLRRLARRLVGGGGERLRGGGGPPPAEGWAQGQCQGRLPASQ